MHPFNEPMMIDPNTVVNHYSWERNSDAVRAFMNTNQDIMTDPVKTIESFFIPNFFSQVNLVYVK